MHRWLMGLLLVVMFTASALAQDKPKEAAPEKKNETVILDTLGFSRNFYVLRPPVVRKDGKLEKVDLKTKWLNRDTFLPPADWREIDFDDSEWYRGPGVLTKRARRDVGAGPPPLALACRRYKFAVTEPDRVGDLQLTVAYRGGVVVYLNGTEILRGHLPNGKIAPLVLAEDYPLECHVKQDGSPLIWKKYTETKEVLRRLALRIREVSNLTVPKHLLRKGTNVLAVELHRSALHPKTMFQVRKGRRVAIAWGTCGLLSLRMTARSPEGIVQNAVRNRGVQVWNSSVLTSDFDQDFGDQNEPLQPIRIVGTRGGSFSGKIVVGSAKPIKGLLATLTPLVEKQKRSVIAPNAVQIRYALPWGYEYNSGNRSAFPVGRMDALSPTVPTTVEVRTKEPRNRRQKLADLVPRPVFGAVCPIWVTVSVPPDARPGNYHGTLVVTVPGKVIASLRHGNTAPSSSSSSRPTRCPSRLKHRSGRRNTGSLSTSPSACLRRQEAGPVTYRSSPRRTSETPSRWCAGLRSPAAAGNMTSVSWTVILTSFRNIRESRWWRP